MANLSTRHIRDMPEFIARFAQDGRGPVLSPGSTIRAARRRTIVSKVPLLCSRLRAAERREREVLARLAIGETNKEIARHLGLSARTVEGYRAAIMRKVGALNAAELLRRVFSQSSSRRTVP